MFRKKKKVLSSAAKNYNHHQVTTSQSCESGPQYPDELLNILPTVNTSDINRKAIELSGRVGFQYDASLNNVLKRSQSLRILTISTPIDVAITCCFIKGEITNHDTLLKLLQIDEQLTLNLLLSTTSLSSYGTHSIIFNSRQWNDNRTRILFYRRSFKNETLQGKPKKYLPLLKKVPLQPNTTHIITSVSLGVEFLIVLQASSQLSILDVDEQLHKLCMALRKNRKLADNDTFINYLDQLTIVATYSNMGNQASLMKMSSAYDHICHFNMDQSQPIFYQLCPVATIYSTTNVIYFDIDYGIVYNIQSEIFALYHLLDDAQQLCAACKKPELRQLFEQLQNRYFTMQKLLTVFTSGIHQGKNSDALVEYFDQTDYRSLVTNFQKYIEQARQVTHTEKQLDSLAQGTSLLNPTEVIDLNILLLGETGVGKSTFINALVNYLQFNSLEQARDAAPVVLIPTSFLITLNNDFKEITVNFGTSDPNELHNKQGRSVTQQCKVYETSIENHINLKIIDTPGIGDTRGVKQDKINIQNIRSFVQKLSHLNAICILLKPNVERLDASFRLCLVEIFDLLGPNVGNNILFCFTNTRATFYAPGDTAPLLDEMLKQIPGDRIAFEKSNTFCFDSESFRYLAATKQGIRFQPRQERDYQESWTNSANEAKRFFNHIRSLKTNFLMNRNARESNYF